MLIDPCDPVDIWAITSAISDGAKPGTSVEVGPPMAFRRSSILQTSTVNRLSTVLLYRNRGRLSGLSGALWVGQATVVNSRLYVYGGVDRSCSAVSSPRVRLTAAEAASNK